MNVMSSADVAVQVFRSLEKEDFKVLQAIEAGMSQHEFVPESQIAKIARFDLARETDFRLSRLSKMGLIYRQRGAYVGYTLNYAGYDCLAINALVKTGLLEAFGKPLGVGKEADVYDAITAKGRQVAVKFHRLGRISFRQTQRKRGYVKEHEAWLFQSRQAAEKEFQCLQILFSHGVAVPEPLSHNRHVLVMGMIEGAELAEWKKLPHPKTVLREILRNVRKAYLKAGIIHADLSEYNIILRNGRHILIIDWPQYVTREHPNALLLLERDVKNVLRFFSRKRILKYNFKEALDYVTGKNNSLFAYAGSNAI
ncbi:MAG: serine/threonine-protein kinase RIO2 [Candidatus Bathyarchaeia archaeon]